MNINLTILISFIIIAIAIFAASVIHYHEPYEFLIITNPNGDENLIRIHKLNSHVDIFYPSDSGITNFNWVRLNES
ncbi:MAG: hypothetical protein VXZ44_00015 [Verrucomicrobiota bacterium]|nr:hypothetical protein [Verrucomicrobiota bacterium]